MLADADRQRSRRATSPSSPSSVPSPVEEVAARRARRRAASGSWPTVIVSPSPNRKPVITGLETRSEIAPSRSAPPATSTTAVDERERGRQRGEARGVAARERADGRGRQRRRRGGRAHDERARRAEQRVGDHRARRRHQPGLGRQPGDLRVGDRLRRDDAPDDDAGDHVRPQPCAPVARQPRGQESRGAHPRWGVDRGSTPAPLATASTAAWRDGIRERGRRGRPALSEHVAYLADVAGDHEPDARALEVLGERRSSMRAAVTSTNGIVSASRMTALRARRRGVGADPGPDGVGVGEEQPALDPQDGDPGRRLVLGMALEVARTGRRPAARGRASATCGRDAR